ncbi:hypothetical protein G4B88_011723 [Cannabis sativa]|uniref:Protein kinase domain-containing protein n=1 Tax=Cannabis sativa TaxID=3483 RepID=A0A7J6DLQ8_CANSA|nr:hypothetical protein G4B88_011723 [Cannabis sativa]
MKGMLTGPVTILNWSFVRNDQPRSETCYQIALAIKDEVEDLEKAGITVIQIDEAALREGLPLRKSEQAFYLDWAVHSFRITNCGVQDTTQIHTHMCYSNFNGIIHSIINVDADVITIENSRSDEKLLSVFREGVKYGAGIGPGVYDIHSPRIPSAEEIADRINKMLAVLETNILWVNPDCGLKTRKYTEVKPALSNMVAAAKLLRSQLASANKSRKEVKMDLSATWVGSPYYVVPKVLRKHYGPECDVWSAGVIIYILHSGVPPFWDELEQGIFEQVLRGELDFISEPWPSISESAKDLVRRMLVRDPKKRLTAHEVLSKEVVAELKAAGATWIQFDEPTLVKDLDSHQLQAFTRAYSELESSLSGLNVIIESYFADVPAEAYKTLTSLKGVAGYGFDLVNETKLDAEIKSWLAFAAQKVVEVNALAKALSGHKDEAFFAANAAAQASRKSSPRVTNEHVQKSAAALKGSDLRRATNVSVRLDAQQKKLSLPVLPTTTIGSFPQTMDLRRVRREYKAKKISEENYVSAIKEEINKVIKLQEELDIDILLNFSFVNQRNDMVEYFGEQLSGFAFTVNGWVQSYGSCCVKPPIIYGDVSRPKAMTVFWSSLAQSLTKRPMKGMLTGPVTILNWSFVRNDQPRSVTCYQIALAIKDEVEDLEKAVVCMTSTHQGSHLQKKSLTGSIRCLLSWRLTFCKCRKKSISYIKHSNSFLQIIIQVISKRKNTNNNYSNIIFVY